MKFRKKPVEVMAERFESPNQAHRFGMWCGGVPAYDEAGNVIGLDIGTLEGVMRANVGDWIIEGVKGEFYPCKPDIFEMTYEPAGA